MWGGKQQVIYKHAISTITMSRPVDNFEKKAELSEYISRQKARGVGNIKSFEIELERRYAMIAASFILTIIGLSLSSKKVKGGMGVNIGIGLLLSFSYILFMAVTSSFAISGMTSPRVAMWIPNVIYTIIAIVLYRKAKL